MSEDKVDDITAKAKESIDNYVKQYNAKALFAEGIYVCYLRYSKTGGHPLDYIVVNSNTGVIEHKTRVLAEARDFAFRTNGFLALNGHLSDDWLEALRSEVIQRLNADKEATKDTKLRVVKDIPKDVSAVAAPHSDNEVS